MITAGCIEQVYFLPGSAGIAAANSKFAIRNKKPICDFKVGFSVGSRHKEEISFSTEDSGPYNASFPRRIAPPEVFSELSRLLFAAGA
jgi:hypothetical protein